MADTSYLEGRGTQAAFNVKAVDNGDGTYSLSVVPRSGPVLKYAVISASGADNTLVAAVADKKIRVHQVYLRATASCSVRFESGTGGTALTGVMPVVAGGITAVLSGANGEILLPYSPEGWFETAVNTLLNLELSASSVFGVLGYTEV